MRSFKMLVAILAATWPLSASAVELDLGLGTELVYDNNVFRTADGQSGDGSLRLTPSIGLVQSFENAKFDVYYKPTYEAFMTDTTANGFTHFLSNSIEYRVNPKTTVEASNLFRVQDVLNYEDANTVDDDTAPLPSDSIRRDQFILNDTAFTLTRAMSARWTANTDIGFSLFDPGSRDNTVASKTVSATQSFNYQMNTANRFGVGGGAVIQMYDGINSLPGNDTYIYRLFGSYQRTFGESTTLSIQLGPAFIVTKQNSASGTTSATFPFQTVDRDMTVAELQDSGVPITFDFTVQGLTPDTVIPAGSVVVPNPIECNSPNFGVTTLFTGEDCFNSLVLRNDPSIPSEYDAIDDILKSETSVVVQGSNRGTDDSSFSLFGEVTLVHNWTPNLYSQLSYNRSQSAAAGLGATAIADSVSFFTQWLPSPLWDVSMRASYVKRKSPTDLSRTFLQVTRDPDPMSDTAGLVQLNGFSTYFEDSKVVDTNRVDVAVRAARRLTQHITVSGRLGYGYQSSVDASQYLADFSDFTAMLGFKYDFDPFQL